MFEYSIDAFFMLEILVAFNTGYYRKGNLVIESGKIILYYFCTWFFIDLIASIPYSWILGDNSESE